MAESQRQAAAAQGLLLLQTRLSLDKTQQQRAQQLFNGALEYLGRQRTSSPSLLGQEQPSATNAWAPCTIWLLKSVPGLLAGPQTDQPAQDSLQCCLPLSELLEAYGISLVSFFKELPVVLNKLRPWLSEVTPNADAVDNVLKLREWQETLVSLTHLANKYKDLFWHIQRSSSSSAAKQPLLRAGWLAFLTVKAQLLPGFPDLVSCLELLVCVLNMLLASSDFNEQQLQELQQQSPAAIGADGRFCTLKALSQEAKVDFANTKALMPRIEACFREHLNEASFSWLPKPLPAELPHPDADKLDTCCALHLEGLVTNQQQLSELVLSLDTAYQTWYNQQGEIDEREFLLTDFGALASPRTLPGASIHMSATALGASADARSAIVKSETANGSSTHAGATATPFDAGSGPTAMAVEVPQQQLSPLAALAAAAAMQQQRQKPPLVPGGPNRRSGLVLQGLQSPLPTMNLGPPGPQTPITQAMSLASWLRGLTRSLTLEPSPALQRYMDAAGAEAGPVLVERVKAAAEAVFMSDGAGDPMLAGGLQGLQHGLAQERRTEGIKLYWHVLEAMLKAEEARAGLPAAGALLTRWPFHQCLLACSFEVVAASYRMGLLSFPAIPAKLGLKPFDLSKMVGPFVKAESSLPRELKRHMFTVEEKILESLGWAPGSSFYKLIRAATGQSQQQRSTAAAAAAQQQANGDDAQMQDAKQGAADEGHGVLPTAEEQQQELQQEAAAAAAIDAEQKRASEGGSGTPSAAVATDLRRRSFQGIKRGSNTGSAGTAGEPMETDAGRAGSGSPSVPSAAAKRQRGQDGRVTDSGRNSPAAAAAAAVSEDDMPLPRALGLPPGSNGVASGGSSGGDPSALAVLHDYCRKVLKLAAFRLVAVSEGLDFSPMTRDDVVAHVHELLAAALYQHTYLFYSRHLDTLLLACLYGFCKVNRLQQITFREILTHYKRQAHAKQEVFRTVVLQQTDPHLVTQDTGDIIAFYNAVFVPAMKSILLQVNPPMGAAEAAHVRQQGPTVSPSAAAAAGASAVAADAAGSSGKPSPMQTAMQLSASQQQPQQWSGGRTASGAISPGSSGSAYRALNIPGPSAGAGAGGGSTSLGLGGLSSGNTLLGALPGGPLSMPQTGAGGHGAPAFGGGAGAGGSSSFWTSTGDAAGPATAADPAGAAAAAGSAAPSRLSRLSRPGGPGTGPVGTAVATEALQMPGGTTAHAKAAAAGLQPQQLRSPAAADALQQQDQGFGQQRSGAAGFRSSSEPQSPSAGGDYRDSSTDRDHQPGSSISPMAVGTAGVQQQQQPQGVGNAATAGRSPAAATVAAAGSPSAGLATLMQALDTTGGMPSPSITAAAQSGYGAGAVPSSCGQQQAAVKMEM